MSHKVPSPELKTVQALCEIQQPYENFQKSDSLFLAAMQEALQWHYRHSSFFANYLDSFCFDPNKSFSLEEIPFLPAEFFKRNEVVTIPQKEVSLHLTSSGTSGQKSQMFFDPWSIGSAQRMVDWIFAYYGWTTDSPSNYLLYSYEITAGNKLGTAFTDHYLCKHSPPKRVESALKLTGDGGHEFDSFGCIRILEEYAEEKLPVRIFGFPAFLHFTLKRRKKLGYAPIKLHPDSFVFLGGGWKGNADKAIAKLDLYREVHEQLGIPDERIRDGFGSVEHCIPYIECKHHHFHVPVWSRAIIRDVRTLKPLPFGTPGFLQFLSPYITSVPANSVLMGDLAQLFSADSCPCGLGTPWFEVLGRAGTSKNKSCAIAASELLRKSAP